VYTGTNLLVWWDILRVSWRSDLEVRVRHVLIFHVCMSISRVQLFVYHVAFLWQRLSNIQPRHAIALLRVNGIHSDFRELAWTILPMARERQMKDAHLKRAVGKLRHANT
jgi:hypothetical protein